MRDGHCLRRPEIDLQLERRMRIVANLDRMRSRLELELRERRRSASQHAVHEDVAPGRDSELDGGRPWRLSLAQGDPGCDAGAEYADDGGGSPRDQPAATCGRRLPVEGKQL